jgi:hypothetical protein
MRRGSRSGRGASVSGPDVAQPLRPAKASASKVRTTRSVSSQAGVSIKACETLAFIGRSPSWKLPARDRHFEGGGRRLYIFSPGRLLACSIQETSWSSSSSSS